MHTNITNTRIIALLCFLGTMIFATEPGGVRIPIYVTPYYDSENSKIDAGTLSADLLALTSENSSEVIKKAESQLDKLPVHALFILAIKLYDVGKKDESVKWFYIARLRNGYLFSVIEDAKLGGIGSIPFELKCAHDALTKLAGQYINGYAFGDPDKLIATLKEVTEKYSNVPEYKVIYPSMASIISESNDATKEGTLNKMHDLMKYIEENKKDILIKRKENGIEGKY